MEVEILDSAPEWEFLSARVCSYSMRVDGFVFVYSAEDPGSLQDMEAENSLYNRFLAVRDPSHPQGDPYPVVLVAAKVDVGRSDLIEGGRALAHAWGVPFVEASAKTPSGVDDVFIQAIRQVRECVPAFSPPPPPPPSSSSSSSSSSSTRCTLS